mmetsp:Transcript_36616/g.122619  ORF Transcript_36616/g.122619 Transcript_36616/m.122619 type:complete len:216 (-) Transcript_36616:100-747(-)
MGCICRPHMCPRAQTKTRKDRAQRVSATPPQKRDNTHTRSFRISAHAPLHARPRIAPRPGPTPLATAREQMAAHGSQPVGSMRAMRGKGGGGGAPPFAPPPLHIEPLNQARVQPNESLAPAALAGDCAEHGHCRPLELLPREALPQDQAAPALSNFRLGRDRSVHQQRAVEARPGDEHGELAVLCSWPGEGALERHLVFIVGVPLIAHFRRGSLA